VFGVASAAICALDPASQLPASACGTGKVRRDRALHTDTAADEVLMRDTVVSLRRDEAELLMFFDFPAEHWVHLRTANVIESPFATVRLRQRVTKGAGSRQKGLLMAFKLLAMAEGRWRRINGAHLIPLVRAGVQFGDGIRLERRSAA
jgi:hypothetical protein